MADTTPDPAAQQREQQRASKFHYYSGGEIKEQADTRVSRWYYALCAVVIIGGILYALFGGALGPNNPLGGGFKPGDASQSNINALQGQLAQNAGTVQYASVDLNALPIPQGQTISQAVVAGSDVYQTYCIGCHGPNQDGNGVNAASLNPKPRNLHDAPFMQAMSYQRITTSLHKGVPGTAMPRWENTLTNTQIQDVIAYVFSLTAPTAPSSLGNQASGGANQYAGGSVQNSPKPITPAIGGSPAASSSTAPPSTSGSVNSSEASGVAKHSIPAPTTTPVGGSPGAGGNP